MANPEKTAPLKTPEVTSELEQLRAENERLKADRAEMIGAMDAGAKKLAEQGVRPVGVRPVLPVVKGKAVYKLTEPHYREGQLYKAGQKITVHDEAPGKSWVRLDGPNGKKEPEVKSTLDTEIDLSRAADKQI